jgi:hypothetical protein
MLRRRPKQSPAPFIVGVARSGTTLLRLMLDAHPELTIPPETHFAPRVIRAWDRGEGLEEAIQAIVSHRRWPDFGLGESELRRRLEKRPPSAAGDVLRAFYGLYAEAQGKPRWGDKSTNYVRQMRPIHRALPEARFVHLIRDGRDVALSLVAVYFGPTSIAEAAQKWRHEISKARRQASRIDNYIEVRYEELVADPEPILRRVCEFSRIEWDPAMLGYREGAAGRMGELNRDLERRAGVVTAAQRAAHQANVAKPLSTRRSGSWRVEMSHEDRATFEHEAGDLLVELGYEQ